MFLLQLLRLLLVSLFHLLRSGRVRLLFRQLLVFFLLLLLDFLPFLLLLRSQLLLLLLIFLVQLRITRVGRGRPLRRRKILNVYWRAPSCRFTAGLATATICRLVRSTCLLRLYYSAAAEFPRPCGGGDGRLAVVR